MSTIAHNTVAKLAVAFVAVAMLASVAAPARAQTIEELQAMIAQLQAQISALSGGSSSTSSSCTFTRSLTIGSQGADVTCLQEYLTATGHFTFAGGATGYFGPVTQSAVAAWQAANGVSPAVGYFGPISMAKYSMMTAGGGDMGGDDDMGSDDDDMSDDLSGGAGSIGDADFITKLSNEEVGEDEEDVEVAGLEIEADGSDIELRAVTLDFDYADTAADEDLDDYASEVSVWFEGEEIARVDADEFEDDDEFEKTLTLDSGAVIREDDMGELVVAISGVSNLDTTNQGEKWNVQFVSVRFVDGQGSVVTDSSTGDISNTDDDDTSTDSYEREFSFESFASAADLEFKVSKGDDDINDARSIEVSSTTDTDNVEILSFEVEVEGDSDVTVDDLAVDFATSTGDLLTDLISSAELVVDGDVIGSENIVTAYNDDGVVVFDNLDWTIDAGDTVEVIVRVDMNELNTGTFAAGATLSASVDPDNANWDVEDEEGETVGAGDKTGSASSDSHTFYADGIQVEMNSVSKSDTTVDSDNNDYTTLTIKFDVTAFGEDAYVRNVITNTVASSSLVLTAPTAAQGVGIAINSNDSDINATGTKSVTLTSTADEETNSFKVEEGETETFTAQVVVTNGSGGGLDAASVRAILTGVGFAATDSSSNGDYTVFTSNVTDIKTDYGYIAN
jgi:peptidoglycan hydrolase-like protein with peptidoglycan-binding domain